LHFVTGMIVLIISWQLIIWIGQFNEALFPGLVVVFQALVVLISDDTLFVHLKDSLFRFTIGYVRVVVTAVVTGLLLGRSKIIWQIIDPIVQILRPISPVAWSPFVVLAFGIGDTPAIVIIFIAAFFPVLL